MQVLIPCLALLLSLAQSSVGWYSSYKTCDWAFRPNPLDCGTYFQCNFGEPILRQCSEGLHWNAKVNTCDWKKNAKCSTTAEIEAGNVIERDDVCSGTPPYKADPLGDCRKYFWCVNNLWIPQECPGGLYWNPKIQGCDWKENAGCSESPVGPPAPPGPTTTSPPAPTETPTPSTTEQPVGPPASPPPSETEAPDPSPPAPPPEEGSPSPGKYKVICYYTGWSTYRQGVGKFTPANVDKSLCTHIVYAFTVLDTTEWKIKIADTWMDIDNHYYEQITSLKKAGKKVTIGVGGWNDSEGSRWSNLLREPSRLISFIQSVVTFIQKYNFDGIDLDYEYPGCPWGACSPEYKTDKSGFTALVIGLRNALPKPYIISAAVSCNRNVIDTGYDVSTISKYLDWIGVMAYDIHGSWDKRTGHIAPMYAHPLDTQDYLNVNSSINHWMMRGADPTKLILGIPLYGNSFTLSNPSQDEGLFAPTRGPGASGPFTKQGGIISYYEICSQQWEKKVQDEEGRMGPFLVKGDQWISYDDQSSIIKKTNYIKSLGLGGAMVWSLDFDDFANLCGQGNYPLLKTVQKSLIAEGNSRKKQRRRYSTVYRY